MGGFAEKVGRGGLGGWSKMVKMGGEYYLKRVRVLVGCVGDGVGFLIGCVGWTGVIRWFWIKGEWVIIMARSVWFVEISHKDQNCNYPKHEGPNLPFSKLCLKDHFCQVKISQGSILHFSIFFKFPGTKIVNSQT